MYQEAVIEFRLFSLNTPSFNSFFNPLFSFSFHVMKEIFKFGKTVIVNHILSIRIYISDKDPACIIGIAAIDTGYHLISVNQIGNTAKNKIFIFIGFDHYGLDKITRF